MTFKVPPSEKDEPENRFEFEIEGTEYSVPLLRFAPVEASLAFEEGRNIEGLLLCAGDEAGAAMRGLDRAQLSDLEDAWVKASRVSPGESDGSAGS
jgi:hypothetical protein